ncbi:MAG: hypothetical protein M1337_07420 [Actinobacteria bacterium]|nr:hypothetical protein [Actinomycetota bacterium]
MKEAAKASGVSNRIARPKFPLLSSMVASTMATASIIKSTFFISCPSFPVPVKGFIVEDGSDNSGEGG